MRPIDEKIISMKLDNQDFSKKATETTGIIGGLVKALNLIPGVNLGKTATDLGALRNQANKMNLGIIADGVQAISNKFTALGIVGVTALANIANRAVNAGITLSKSLTIDQVTAGFKEYELKIGSIQTILSNTKWNNTSLKDVKGTLEELNTYADQTIYSFSQMTQNIGRFTAAGVSLGDSTVAIKGLSNLAAASGSSADQLNTAMYQMSQAMSSGKLNLMDWNSLVNAGMGGKVTQDALLKTARNLGVVVNTNQSFRESIADGWITSKVFLETLKQFGKDKSMIEAATKVRTLTQFINTLKESIGSGWATTFENIFGDFEQATTLWSGVSERVTAWVGKTSDARNKFLKESADLGAMKNIFDGVSNAITPIIQIFKAMKEGFEKVFPPTTVARFVQLTKTFKEFTAGLALSGSSASKLTTIFQGIFALFSTVIEIAKRLTSAFVSLIPKGTGGGILDLLVKLAELSISFNKSIKEGNILTAAIDAIAKGLIALGGWIKNSVIYLLSFGGSLKTVGGHAKDSVGSVSAFGEALKNVGGHIADVFDRTVSLGKALWEKLGVALKYVIGLFQPLMSILKPIGVFIGEIFKSISVGDVASVGALVTGFLLFTKIGNVLKSVIGIFTSFKGNMTGLFDIIKNGTKSLFGGLGEALSAFASQVKYNNLLKIAIAIGVLAVSLKILESLNTADIVQGLTALATTLGLMLGGMALIDKFSLIGGVKASITLVGLALAVTIMAVALKKVSSLDPNALAIGIGALLGTVTALTIAIIGMSKLGGKIETGSIQLIALATAILIMTSALEKLSGIKTGDLYKAVGALSIILVQMGIFIKVVNGANIGLTSSLGIIIMANAIGIMAGALAKLSKLDGSVLISGLLTITAILTQMILFSKLSNGPQLALASVGVLLIAVALTELLIPIRSLGSMSWDELLKGLSGISIAMIAIGGASKLMSGTIGAGLGMVAMAAGLAMLVAPIKMLSGMSWPDLIKGLTGITVAMLAIAGASYLMSSTIGAGLGMMAMAVGLTTLLIPIKAFASMSWAEMLKGFAGLAIAMTVVAVAALLLAPAIVPMLGFGAGLALIGVAMLAAGVGFGLFATGLIAVAGLSVAAIASIIVALKAFIEGLGSLIKYVVKFVVDLGSALLDGIELLVPKLIRTVVNLILTLIKTIVDKVPEFQKLGATFIINLMNGMGEWYPKIIAAGINMIINVVNGVTDALVEQGPRIRDAFQRLFGEIIVFILESGVDMINALLGWMPGVKKATSKIGETATKYIRDNFGAQEVGETKGDEFIAGLSSKEAAANKAGTQFGFSANQGLESGTTQSKFLGVNFGQGFIQGMNSKSGDVSKAAWSMGDFAKLGMQGSLDMHSPSKVTEMFGGFTAQGFIQGMQGYKSNVKDSSKSLADTAKGELDQSKDAKELGGFTGQGFSNGLTDTKPKVKMAAKSLADVAKEQFDKMKEWIDDRKYYNQLSLQEELAAWQRIQAKYKAGTDERKQADREVYRVKQELIKADVENSKKWIDDRKYYNNLSLKEELAAWERVQSRYKAGTEERKQADREVYRLHQELIKADVEFSKNWIDDRKYYNDLSLTEELAAWERVQSRYKAGTEERKQADREVYRLKNELNTKLVQLNEEYTSKVQEANKKLLDDELQLKDDYTSKVEEANKKLFDDELRLKEERDSKIDDVNKKSLDDELRFKEEYNSKVEDANKKLFDEELRLKNDYENSVKETNDRLISEEARLTDEYNKAVEDRTKSLVSFAGLFDEVPKQSDVSGQQLIDNLKGQVDGFNNWSDDIKTLSGRAIDEGLLTELTNMGPKAAGEIAALNTLTDEQLTEYSDLWKSKSELARIEATREMETLRKDTASKIEKLRAETNTQLEAYKNDWSTKTEELRVQTVIQLETLKNDYYTKTEELRIQTANQLAIINNDWQNKVNELRTQIANQLDQYKKDWETKVDELRKQTAIQLEAYKTEWIKKIEELSKGTKDKFVDLKKDMSTIGADAIAGMMSGMKSMEGPLQAQAKAMADSVAAAMKTTLKIKSPSRVLMALGAFAGEGLADGIGSQVKNVADKAKQLALTAKDSLNKFLEGFNLPQDDNEIHIKAVVDWDGFDPNDINTMPLRITPDSSFTTGMVGEVIAKQRQNDDNVLSDPSGSGPVGNKSTVINQNLTFNSRQLSPSEVARKNLQASRQLAMQWGV